jgi:hypothetical protein
MTTSYLAALSRRRRKGSSYQVQLELGTRHKKYSLHKKGEEVQSKKQRLHYTAQVEEKHRNHIRSASGQVTCEFWGPVGPWLWKEVKVQGRKGKTRASRET